MRAPAHPSRSLCIDQWVIPPRSMKLIQPPAKNSERILAGSDGDRRAAGVGPKAEAVVHEVPYQPSSSQPISIQCDLQFYMAPMGAAGPVATLLLRQPDPTGAHSTPASRFWFSPLTFHPSKDASQQGQLAALRLNQPAIATEFGAVGRQAQHRLKQSESGERIRPEIHTNSGRGSAKKA